RPDIKQDARLLMRERKNDPFVEDDVAIELVHLLRAYLNILRRFVQCHKTLLSPRSKAISRPLNKGFRALEKARFSLDAPSKVFEFCPDRGRVETKAVVKR